MVGLAPRHLRELPAALLLLLLRRQRRSRDPAPQEALGPSHVGGQRRPRDDRELPEDARRPALARRSRRPSIRAAVHARHARATGARARRAPPGFRLFEHEYEMPVEQEDKRIVVNTVMRSLRELLPERDPARGARRRPRAAGSPSRTSSPSTWATSRCSCAWTSPTATADGRVVIVDWKTGRGEGRFNEVQLAGYALYAAEQGWVRRARGDRRPSSPTSRSRATCGGRVDARKLEHARRFIEKSAGDMKALLLDPVAQPGPARGLPDDRPARRSAGAATSAGCASRARDAGRPRAERRSPAALGLASALQVLREERRRCAPRRPWPPPRGSRPRGC